METPLQSGVTVGTDHPGGNAIVRGVDADAVRLRPDDRDSLEPWFYWNVTLRAERAGRRRITFGDRAVVGPRGPAIGHRDGTWTWLGSERRIDATAFEYDFDAGERVRLAFSLPYQQSDFEAVYDRYAAHGRLHRETLTTAESGRAIPMLRIGTGDRHVVVTARHHACESPASYVLEGVLRELLERTLLPPDYCVHLVPFVDLDGVERGDQGKHRAPHDHNRDYVEGNAISDDLSPLYRSTGAIMTTVRNLDGELDLALDLHCPYKWGGDNDRPFFVAAPTDPDPTLEGMAHALDATTDRHTDGLDYDATPGVGVHKFDGQTGNAPTFRSFARRAGARLAATLEVPYVGTDTDPVTPESTRAFGRALAAAIGEWAVSGESS